MCNLSSIFCLVAEELYDDGVDILVRGARFTEKGCARQLGVRVAQQCRR